MAVNETEYELHRCREKLTKTVTENNILREALKDAVNEMCMKCSRYKGEHLGACDQCKWHPVKFGELPV